MKKRTVYSLESDIRRILEGNDFVSTDDEGGKQWYMNLVTDLANFVQREIEKAREEGRREVYEAIVFDKNIPHDVTTFVAAHLWKNMRDKAKEELSKLKDNK